MTAGKQGQTAPAADARGSPQSSPITLEELAAIEARAAAATPGPWVRDAGDDVRQGTIMGPSVLSPPEDPTWTPDYADAVFIAAARTDVPRLCQGLREKEAVLESLVARVGQLTQALLRLDPSFDFTTMRSTAERHQAVDEALARAVFCRDGAP